MKIKSLNISKSKTIGTMTDTSGKTRFRKIQISVQVDIGDDDPKIAYQEASQFIEKQFLYESTIK